MNLITERRSLILSPDVLPALEDDREQWIGFECHVDEIGHYTWKSLLLKVGREPVLICTTRARLRVHKSAESAIKYFRSFYEEAEHLELPVEPGQVGPRKHPVLDIWLDSAGAGQT